MGSRASLLLVGAAAALSLVGCGGGGTLTFSRKPYTVHLRVGEEIRVTERAGECGSPWSTHLAVIAPRSGPIINSPSSCPGGTVRFKAISPGQAQIRGALPCRVPLCAEASAIIRVTVART